jgi:hypothetical protein
VPAREASAFACLRQSPTRLHGLSPRPAG